MNDVAPRLAARIAEIVPCAKAVKFVSDGAEATFYALRLARAFTGRDLVLKFEGAYHGHHDYSLHGLEARARRQLSSWHSRIPPEFRTPSARQSSSRLTTTSKLRASWLSRSAIASPPSLLSRSSAR